MSSSRKVVFCDFDGTVAKRDVGYNLFRHFSGERNRELVDDWMAGRISSRDILTRQAEMVHASPEEIFEFLDKFELDGTFADFHHLCQANGVELIIVSEGLEFYIRRLLDREGLAYTKVISNIGVLKQNRLFVEFPYSNRTCQRCGSCKGERIAEYRQAVGGSCAVAFVGDGYSDACAAGEADILFAKKDLLQYCQSKNIAYNEFEDFRDVAGRLAELGFLVA
ncbi:MAG: 2-hydroxy-3-keto-5-methylthiopentenyl-1-phosphate phosphatase [Candidatus Zixiibacteriota bacterium]|nr:MAG: 2-hydroxy-3-keto-5-methylthiopentenyl-1-phosphate phosphatase [candidate division Zixibacteria bacterium]